MLTRNSLDKPMTMPPEGTVRLNLHIDKSLHHQFKVACVLNGERMTDVVLELIQTFVDQHPAPTPPKARKKK